MRGTRLRRVVPAALGLIVLTASVAYAAVSWPSATGSHARVGPANTWNYGSSMGRTANGRLALVYSTDYVKGDWASDSGPYQGTFVMTGKVETNGDVTWSKGKLVSQGKKHSERPALATAGKNVYALWVTQTSYDNYNPSRPRVAFVRSNPSNGAPSAWSAPVRLTPAKGRVDYPVIAAAGSNVYVVYTNSANGAMIVKRSTDSGATFSNVNVGSTTRVDEDDANEGFAGWPGICASGSNVGVVWLSKPNGELSYAISTNGGATFPTKGTLAASGAADNNSWSQCDAIGSRIGVTWTTSTALKYREYNTGSSSWGAERTAAPFPSAGAGTYKSGYGPAVDLIGTGQVGISWGDCKQVGCDYYKNVTRIDLAYIESANSGAAWGPRQLLASSGVKGKTLNDSANVLFWNATTRYIVYNGWTANYASYRLYLTRGTGSV